MCSTIVVAIYPITYSDELAKKQFIFLCKISHNFTAEKVNPYVRKLGKNSVMREEILDTVDTMTKGIQVCYKYVMYL